MEPKRRWLTLCFCLLACVLPGGCAIFGVAANALPRHYSAKYQDLRQQQIGVLAWADRGIQLDWEDLPLDLATKVQERLETSKAEELKEATFPWKPASVLRFMRERPELEMAPITQVAPRMSGISRLIYIEVESFSTRSHAALELYRGSAMCTLRVVEIRDGQGAIGYEENNIQVEFPKDVPQDGLPAVGDARIYQGTLDALAEQIVWRLISHTE